MMIDGVYFGFDDVNIGSIELGKVGDLVLFSVSLFEVLIIEIEQIEIDVMVVVGTVVYDCGCDGGLYCDERFACDFYCLEVYY